MKTLPAEPFPAAEEGLDNPISSTPPPPARPQPRRRILLFLLVYLLGLGSGYLLWEQFSPLLSRPGDDVAAVADSAAAADSAAGNPAAPTLPAPLPSPTPVSQETPSLLPQSYTLPVSFGDIGPQLLETGAIDYDKFVQVYERAGQPLTEEQLTILTTGSDAPITFTPQNAYFLLNFFWALGLVNRNTLLTDGPMQQYSDGDIGRFASTGGWTIGARPATDLYASAAILTLTPEQQGRFAEVASAVYRPCCNNPTAFPDCNHGMAMFGLLELLAAQDATTDELFEAAKYANAFWFPQQSYEIALFFLKAKGKDFAAADPRQFVSPYTASASGFQAVHQWLADHDLLEQVPNSGNSCGV